MTVIQSNHVLEHYDHDLVDYEFIAASVTDQVLGPAGKKGDILRGLILIPQGDAIVGTVRIRDGSVLPRVDVFFGGQSASAFISNVQPFWIPFGINGIRSVDGAWQVQTGASVEVLAVGKFS